jgi:hypothetical protein
MFSGYWGTFKGKKCPGCDSDVALFSTTKVKNEWNYISASHILQRGVDRDKYTVEPQSIVLATIIFPHVLFAIFGPE